MDQNQPSSDGDRREPDEARVSSPVLRGRGGEIPPRYSPCVFFGGAFGCGAARIGSGGMNPALHAGFLF